MEERAKLTIAKIEKSELDLEDKTQLIEQINSSKELCNGVPQEKKVQGLSEGQFETSIILSKIMMMLKEKTPMTWKEVVVKVLDSWKTVVIAGFLTALFAFRPEIAEVLKAFAH